MNENIKISIIVPVYNLQDYLERCIDSILSQTHQNLELLVVDDGSIDNSRNIINKISESDERIVPIFKENGGVTSARLTGIEQATGEWIGFVDGDDEIEFDMYELLLNNAIEYGADISHCGYQMVFSDGRINYFHNSGCLVQQDRTTALKELLDGSLVEPGLWNKLFHKSLFHNLLHQQLMPSKIKINEDLLMNFYLFRETKQSVFEDVCKYRYLIRERSASRQKLNAHKIYDPIRVKEIILSQAEPEILEDAQRAYLRTCVYIYCSLKGREYAKDRKRIRRMILDHRDWIVLQPKKTMLLANLITDVPWLFAIAYPLYEKFLQSNKYD